MENPFDIIDDYLEKNLDSEQRLAFESHLVSNPDLAVAVEEKQALLSQLRMLRLQKLIATTTSEKPLPNSYKWLWTGLFIAFSSILLGYIIWKNDDIPTPIEKNIEKDQPQKPIDNEPRASVESKVTAPIAKAENKNEKEHPINITSNIKDSIDYLIADAPVNFESWKEDESVLRGDNSDSETQYFAAYKKLQLGKYKDAAKLFKSLSINKKFRNYRRAEWYLALAELKLNPNPENQTLNHIISTEGHFFQEKAKKLKVYLNKK